jgi:predicted signal transduction protein with EAL and GGDEF domain
MAKATGDTASTMLQRADAALYDAKRAGRNCVKAQLPAPESEVPAPMKPARVEFA